MSDVALERAGPERAQTIANLAQLYVHDFSDFWGERRVELGEDGRFPPFPHLDTYFSDADRSAFIIRVDAALAGFVLLNAHSHGGAAVDHAVGEFFVTRPYRRQGVGRAAALAAIQARPGRWEIAVARRNAPALAFWRGVAAAVAPFEEQDHRTELWDGAILRFSLA